MIQIMLFPFVFLGLSLMAHAETFQPIVQPISQAEKIVIRGYKGSLTLLPSGSDTIKVEGQKDGNGPFDQWKYEVSQKNKVVEVLIHGPSEQDDWQKVREGKGLPSFQLKVFAPQIPVEIFWNEGKVVSQGWESNMSVQMTKGDIVLNKSKGHLKAQLINGKLNIAEHSGNVDVQSFKGQVVIKSSQGALNLNNHSAIYAVTDHQGPLELLNHSGQVGLNQVNGQTLVRNESGVVRLRDFSGSFEGTFHKGSLDAKVKEIQRFNVNSDDAAITLDVPKTSGALVRLRSEKGRLWAPIYLNKIKKGIWTERKGRLKGKEQGNIKIISKYGDIVLK